MRHVSKLNYFRHFRLFTRTLAFDELIKRASRTTQAEFFLDENEKYYLRSLGDDDRNDVADIKYN